MTEVGRKIEKMRELLRRESAAAVRLRGTDWFAWATGGGDSAVFLGTETGVAELFITAERALVLARRMEQERLEIEQMPREFEAVSFPWIQEEAFDDFIIAAVGGLERVVSDWPERGERPLSEEWLQLKRHLSQREMARYHELGHDAAQAVTEALILAEPEQTENEVAGLAAKALWAKGIQPLMTLVGGESRIARYRDPVPTAARIGERAMLSVCGRRQGLFASLTRFVYFRPPTEDEHRRLHDLAAIEAEAFQATEDLRPLPDIYRRLKAKYLALGYGEEIEKHHQGGATGYLPREELARPQGALGFRVEENTAFAWNPSFAGVKLEDTVVLGVDRRISILTHDSAWPTFECEGRPRPSFLVRA